MIHTYQKGFSWLSVLFFIVVLLALIGVMLPLGFHRGHGSGRIKVLAYAKSVAAALMSFKQENGAYPCEGTRKILEGGGIDFLPPGKDANAYLASNTIDSETAFFAPGGMAGAKEGDNIKGSPERLLERGENCFAYIMAEDERPLPQNMMT